MSRILPTPFASLKNSHSQDQTSISSPWMLNHYTHASLTTMAILSVMTYKMMNKICPESLWDTYKTRNMYSSYRTRNCTDIQLPRYNLEYSKKSFHYSGLKAWNEIPNTIRELSTLQQFKKHLKIHLRS